MRSPAVHGSRSLAERRVAASLGDDAILSRSQAKVAVLEVVG